MKKLKSKTLQSERIVYAEPCPRCGKAETLFLNSTDFEKAKISGVAGKAISHGDHTLVIFFGIRGSHRGQYVYDNDIGLFRRKNNERIQINNRFVHGILVIDSEHEEFDDSCCSIFAEQQTSFMVTTILSTLEDLRVPDGKLAPLTFAGIDLFVLKSKETTILVFPRDDTANLVKQKALSLLNQPITPITIDDIFNTSLIEEIMGSKNRFVRLANTYTQISRKNLQNEQQILLSPLIARELRLSQRVVDNIISTLINYSDGSRNLRIMFDEWISGQITDDWDEFLMILCHLEKNGYLAVQERRRYIGRSGQGGI